MITNADSRKLRFKMSSTRVEMATDVAALEAQLAIMRDRFLEHVKDCLEVQSDLHASIDVMEKQLNKLRITVTE